MRSRSISSCAASAANERALASCTASHSVFKKAKTADFWDDLSIEKRKEIEKASHEIENGEITDYESFMQKHR